MKELDSQQGNRNVRFVFNDCVLNFIGHEPDIHFSLTMVLWRIGLSHKGVSMAEPLEVRLNNLETDIRLNFDIFSNRLDTIRAEGNLHHSELQLQFTTMQTTQSVILRLLHVIEERLRILEERTTP
jgi:hypothetical protein